MAQNEYMILCDTNVIIVNKVELLTYNVKDFEY